MADPRDRDVLLRPRECRAPDCPTPDLCSDSEACAWPNSEWHGWRVMDTNLHVGELPGRKQVVLYTLTHNGSVIHPLAYFKTPEDARTCLDFLDKLAGSRFVLDTLEVA